MPFSSGVSSSLDDFLSQLVSFAVANAGFANEGAVTSSVGSGSRTVQRLLKGGVRWWFTRSTTSTNINASMSYSAFASGANISTAPTTSVADAQSAWTHMNTWAFTGPYVGHYFFTDGTCVHAVLEVASGVFNHISFGNVSKFGTWTGGEYLTGGYYTFTTTTGGITTYGNAFGINYHSRPFNDESDANAITTGRTMVRLANTAASADFQGVRGVSLDSHSMFVGVAQNSGQDIGSMYTRLLRDAPNETTARTPLFPGFFRRYDSASGLYRLAGTIPYAAFMKMSADMNAKDIINTDWQVFPITMRTGGDATLAAPSNEYALAYRRVA